MSTYEVCLGDRRVFVQTLNERKAAIIGTTFIALSYPGVLDKQNGPEVSVKPAAYDDVVAAQALSNARILTDKSLMDLSYFITKPATPGDARTSILEPLLYKATVDSKD